MHLIFEEGKIVCSAKNVCPLSRVLEILHVRIVTKQWYFCSDFMRLIFGCFDFSQGVQPSNKLTRKQIYKKNIYRLPLLTKCLLLLL